MHAQGQPTTYVTAPQGDNQPLVTVQPPQTIATATNQPRPGNWKGMLGTGITQIVLGSLTIVLGIGSFFAGTLLSFVGHPLWCGLCFYVVAGILGVVAGKTQSRCVAIGYMVMSILACLASGVVIGLSSVDIAAERCGGYRYSYGPCSPGSMAVNSLLLILGIGEFVISIAGASMTCSAACITTPAHTVVTYQGQPQMFVGVQPQFVHPFQTVVAPQGQFQPQAYQLQAFQPQAHQPQAHQP